MPSGLPRLAGLTARGQSFLASGVACVVAGMLFAERDLMRLGVFAIALPLIGLAALHRTRYRMSCTRRLDPARVPVGQSATVTLRLENLSRLPTGVLLLEDRLPYRLGNPPRFVLDRMEPMGVREVEYAVSCSTRGRFEIGPLSIRLADPFGLVELTRSFAALEIVLVTPQVHALPRVALGGEWAGSGESRARSVGSAGEQDVAPREYRQGDDLRRVHWRSTARYGELMVRREEQPWQARACVLLDTRFRAHRGEGPDSSFEWAVSAAASVSVSLARGGYVLRFLDSTGAELGGDGPNVEGRLLDGLTDVQRDRDGGLGVGLERLRRGGGEGLVIAVLGALSAGEAAAVARARTGGTTGVALLLDAASWLEDPAAGIGSGSAAAGGLGSAAAGGLGSATTAESPSEAFAASVALLHAAGWRVVPVRAGTALADVWTLAGVRPARRGAPPSTAAAAPLSRSGASSAGAS